MSIQTSTSVAHEHDGSMPNRAPLHSAWSNKYRGVSGALFPNAENLTEFLQATVEDLDPPPALSTKPLDTISTALLSAFERDYTHLTVISEKNRALLGYLSIPRLKQLLEQGFVSGDDPVEKAMQKFRRRGNIYKVITMETPLEDLERFFAGGVSGSSPQDFAVVTDGARRFVLGVCTKSDLEEFVKRRPA